MEEPIDHITRDFMNKRRFAFQPALCILLVLSFSNFLTAQTRVLVWADEFNEQAIDTSTWKFVGGPSNDNVQYYTNRDKNAKIAGDNLQIIALKESYAGYNYTSSMLVTKNVIDWRYGRIEASIKLPSSRGFVPAFWLLPADDRYGWWPSSGEIDIMEHPTNEIINIYGTVHTAAYNSFNGSGSRGSITQINDAESAYHVYAVEWTPDKIDFFVDDQKYFTFNNDHSGTATWPFDQPFYLILNLAVGGDWPGNPDNSTQFPQQMLVDYVRVYGAPRPTAAIPQVGHAWADARPTPGLWLIPAEPWSLLRPLR